MGSAVDEESSSGDEQRFWRKPTQDVEPKSPVVYDKQTYIKFDSFSMMFHKNKSASKDISDKDYVQENLGCILA
jgi:phosphoribosylaminoimidazole-succinocarboxamide synthase